MNDSLNRAVAPGQLPLSCPKCKREVIEPILSKSGPHLRADCPQCKSFMRFLKRTDAGVSMKTTILNLVERLPAAERREVARRILAMDTLTRH